MLEIRVSRKLRHVYDIDDFDLALRDTPDFTASILDGIWCDFSPRIRIYCDMAQEMPANVSARPRMREKRTPEADLRHPSRTRILLHHSKILTCSSNHSFSSLLSTWPLLRGLLNFVKRSSIMDVELVITPEEAKQLRAVPFASSIPFSVPVHSCTIAVRAGVNPRRFWQWTVYGTLAKASR